MRRLLAQTMACALAIGVRVPALHAERLPIVTYTTSDGLAHDRIRCVVPDSKGFLWFCTVDGLSRFDGAEFVNYGPEQGLPNPSVERFIEAGPGVYWIATGHGLARLRSDASRAVTAFSLGEAGASNNVQAMARDRAGRLWVGTGGGLFEIERPLGEPGFRRVDFNPSHGEPPFVSVRALAAGPDGALFIGAVTALYRRLPHGTIVRDPALDHADQIRSLLVDRSGRLWIGHDDRLTIVVPAPSSAFTGGAVPAPTSVLHFETIAGVRAVVRTMTESADGRVWLGTGSGLVEFDGARFRAYTARQGLPHETINAVAEDRAGHVWIGADAGGAVRLARDGLVTFRQEDGLEHEYVTGLFQSRAGRVRVRGGWPVLSEYDGERFASGLFRIPGATANSRLYDIFEDRTGDLWVGSPASGLFRFPAVADATQLARTAPKAIYTTANGLPSNVVEQSFEDSRGDVWGTSWLEPGARVIRWERSTDRFHQYLETDASLVAIKGAAFAEDAAGNMWLGTALGLSRLRDGHFWSIPIEGRTGPVAVASLHVDPRGRLWVATLGSGLFRCDDPTAERPRFTSYGVAQGMSSATVWCLTDDGIGRIYAGTARGVDRLDAERGQITHYGVADGLAGSEVIAAFRDRDGALWFGTFTGTSRLVQRPEVSRGQPAIRIGSLQVRGVGYPLDALGQADVSIGTLATEKNHIQIDYFGLAFEPGARLRYQYQLEGADADWSAPTSDRRVTYAELAPGSYRFQVRAVNADGLGSEVPASVTFTILRPFWQRWWFLTATALLMAGSGYAFHRHRVTRLLEIERLRTRIASDLHDDVGSSLTQISILSEIVRAHLGEPESRVSDPLSRIGTLSRESVDSMSDIVWAIDPLRDAPSHLLQRMRRLANDLLGGNGIQLGFESSGDMSARLDADVRRHTFLMFKEMLHNVVRHADASVVTIEVAIAPGELRLTVTDDGRGFDPAAAAEGQGLRNMARRAATVGGSLDVVSGPGKGAQVTFRLPLR